MNDMTFDLDVPVPSVRQADHLRAVRDQIDRLNATLRTADPSL